MQTTRFTQPNRSPLFVTFVLSMLVVLPSPLGAVNAFQGQLPRHPSYPPDFYQRVAAGERDDALVRDLRQISSAHQNSIGYKAARIAVLGELHLISTTQGYAIKEVYCQRLFTRSDFGGGAGPAPGTTPSDKVINVEHTWPQSRFNRGEPAEVQKSDLHHLFPTDSKMNAIRGNLEFGEVSHEAYRLPCATSKMGAIPLAPGDYFEPPTDHKGNVARAIFYFSMRYGLSIDREEEAYLRNWHSQDPVDADELARNDRIEEIQGNRNPFIDHPDLINQIADF